MNKEQSRQSLNNSGVVFDVGDTILSVDPIRRKALSQLAENIPSNRRMQIINQILQDFDDLARKERYNNHLFGIPTSMFEYSICKHLGKSTIEAQVFSSIYRQKVRALLKPNTRINTMLSHLRSRGAKIGVLTNGTTEGMVDVIRLIGVANYCDVLGISQTISFVKPEPEAFQWMSNALGIPPGRLIMVGNDLDSDILGATASGWKAIWVNGSQSIAPTTVPCLQSSDLYKISIIVQRLLEV